MCKVDRLIDSRHDQIKLDWMHLLDQDKTGFGLIRFLRGTFAAFRRHFCPKIGFRKYFDQNLIF